MDSHRLKAKYLDLLKIVLTRYNLEPETVYVSPLFYSGSTTWRQRLFQRLLKSRFRKVQKLAWVVQSPREVTYSEELRQVGKDWPVAAETMVGLTRLNQLHSAMDYVVDNNIPGDFLEAGIWRGGAGIFMAAFLDAHGISERQVYLADSFEGLPAPDRKYAADVGDDHHLYNYLAVGLDEVTNNFAKYNISLEKVTFLKGFFKETLPNYPGDIISILRMDGDMYSSTIDILENLYHKVSPGGIVIVDDWTLQARQAVEDFLAQSLSQPEFHPIDEDSIYFFVPVAPTTRIST